MVAAPTILPSVEHQDLGCVLECCQSLCDDEGGSPTIAARNAC
jgi:hypothetical protein